MAIELNALFLENALATKLKTSLPINSGPSTANGDTGSTSSHRTLSPAATAGIIVAISLVAVMFIAGVVVWLKGDKIMTTQLEPSN